MDDLVNKWGRVSLDASSSISATAVGLVSPIPPILTGRERRSLSSCEHGGRPVIEGISCC